MPQLNTRKTCAYICRDYMNGNCPDPNCPKYHPKSRSKSTLCANGTSSASETSRPSTTSDATPSQEKILKPKGRARESNGNVSSSLSKSVKNSLPYVGRRERSRSPFVQTRERSQSRRRERSRSSSLEMRERSRSSGRRQMSRSPGRRTNIPFAKINGYPQNTTNHRTPRKTTSNSGVHSPRISKVYGVDDEDGSSEEETRRFNNPSIDFIVDNIELRNNNYREEVRRRHNRPEIRDYVPNRRFGQLPQSLRSQRLQMEEIQMEETEDGPVCTIVQVQVTKMRGNK